MKKLITVATLCILVTSCAQTPKPASTPNVQPKLVWSYDFKFSKPFVRYVNDGQIVIKADKIYEFNMVSGQVTKTDYLDQRIIGQSKIVNKAISDNSFAIERIDGNKTIWKQSYTVPELSSHDLFVYNSDIYLQNGDDLIKYNFADGKLFWSAHFNNLYLKRLLFTSQYVFLFDPFADKYAKVDVKTGKISTLEIDSCHSEKAPFNQSGFVYQDKFYYINSSHQLVKYPDVPDIIIDRPLNDIKTNFTMVTPDNDKLIIISYINSPMSVGCSGVDLEAPYRYLFGNDPETRGLNCFIHVFDRKTANSIFINDLVPTGINYAYTVNGRLVVFTENEIYCFDSNAKPLWTFKLDSQIMKDIGFTPSNVLWADDKGMLLGSDTKIIYLTLDQNK